MPTPARKNDKPLPPDDLIEIKIPVKAIEPLGKYALWLVTVLVVAFLLYVGADVMGLLSGALSLVSKAP